MTNALVPELACQDIQRSLTFYRDQLGFVVLFERPEDRFAYLALGAAEIMVEEISRETWVTASLDPPFGRGLHLQIVVEDVADLRGRQSAVWRELEEVWYRRGGSHLGVRQFCVQDPDGYLLRFQQLLGVRDDLPASFKRGPLPV